MTSSVAADYSTRVAYLLL